MSAPDPGPSAGSVAIGPITVVNATLPDDESPTTVGLPRQRWWQRWCADRESGPSMTTPDIPKLQSLLGSDFDPTDTLRDYITASGASPRIISEGFGPFAILTAGIDEMFHNSQWALDGTLLAQHLDPTRALGVVVKSKDLRDLARRGIPIAAFFRKIPDDVAQRMSAFRAANIPPVANLKSGRPNEKIAKRHASAAESAAAKSLAAAAEELTNADAQQEATDDAYLHTLAQEDETVTLGLSKAFADVDAAKASHAKALKDKQAAKGHLDNSQRSDARQHLDGSDATDSSQATYDYACAKAADAQDALDAARAWLLAIQQDNGVTNWSMGSSGATAEWVAARAKKKLEDAGSGLRERRIAECFAPFGIPGREGHPEAINSWDGTFTYGGGWNMTSGEGAVIPAKLVKPRGSPAFVAGCSNIVEYFQKCGMWFGQKTDLLLVHLEAGGPGYIVTSDQAVKGRFGSAFTYLARNRVLIEAWVSAGMNDALPGQPAASRNDCEPSRDVMYDIQYELFSQNRMVHFGLWAVCATQAAFFFLTHMNHFGSIYQQDQIIRWGVAEGIIPAEVNDPNDTALVPISSGLAIRPSMANDVKLARAGLTYMALKAGYTLGHLNWDSYALLWANFVEDITAGNADLGEPPYSAPPPSRLDTASGPFASSTGPTPSSPAGPASSASAVACPSAMAPEPLPLRPWRLTVEDVLLNAPDDTDMKALEKDLLEQWLIVHGDKRQGWEPVRYLARKLSPEEFAHRQRHAAQPRKAASPKGAA